MTIRIIMINVLTLLCSTNMSAQHVTEAAALAKAQQFMQGKTMSTPGAGKGMRRVATTTDNAAFYMFNAEGGGYVIVSADERTNDILGYSTTGTIDPNHLPDNMRAWLQGYEEQINALSSQPSALSPQTSAPAQVPVHAAVAPMVTAQWDQLAPYYLECPTATPSDGGTPQHCPTGCVATSLAQIMYYYKWPQKSTTAIPAYDYDPIIKIFGRIVYNKHLQKLPATTFNWDIMRDEYNESDADDSAMEVAKLMRYCGQSVKMNYGLDGSGALNDVSVLTDYFGYDSRATAVSRANYGIEEWDALIYHEIEQGRPVWYSGYQPSTGHSFVCDGYDGNGCYHFNWGWSGSYNGFFRLSIVSPAGTGTGGGNTGYGFSINQGAVIGIQPPGADSEELGKQVVAQIALATAGTGSDADCLWAYFENISAKDLTIDGGIGMIDGNGTLTVLKTCFENKKLRMGKNTSTGNYVFAWLKDAMPGYSYIDLPEGSYNLVPVWKESGKTTWNAVENMMAYSYIAADISAGSHTLTQGPVQHVDIDLHAEGSMVTSSMIDIVLSLKNRGDDFTQVVYLFATRSADKGDPFLSTFIALEKEQEETFRYGVYSINEGTYHLFLTADAEGKLVLAETEFTLTKGIDLKIDSEDVGFDAATKTLSVKVANNDSRAYKHELIALISPADATTTAEGTTYKSAKLNLKAGTTSTVTIPCDGIDNDHLYNYQLQLYRNPNKDIISDYIYYDEPNSTIWAGDGRMENKTVGTFEAGDITYSIIDNTNRLAYATACNSEEVTVAIPATVVNPDNGNSYTVKGVRGNIVGKNTTAVVIADGITTMANTPFEENDKLETITLPATLNHIEAYAVYHCPKLKAIYCRSTVPPTMIDDDNLFLIDLDHTDRNPDYLTTTLYVPTGCREAYIAHKEWRRFANIVETDFGLPAGNGDVNGDQQVNVGDIMAIINVMATNAYDAKADVNGDHQVNVGDIMAIINIMDLK